MSQPSFHLAPGQNAFTVAERVSDYVYAFPLGAREPTAIEVSAEFWQLANSYTRPAGDSTITVPSPQNVSNTVTAYFVDDVDFRDLGAGLKEWRRVWATIPASWDEDSQYAFPYPAFSATQNVGNSFAVTAISENTAVSPRQYVLTTGATGFSAGDLAYVDVNYITPGNQNVRAAGTFPVVAASAGASVTITGFYPSGGYGSVTGTVREVAVAPGREEPQTRAVDARIQHDYALTTGAAANVQNTLPTLEKFEPVIASTGLQTEYLSASTLPTASSYASMVAAGTEIVAEPSTRRPYAGLIYERTTIFVKAR